MKVPKNHHGLYSRQHLDHTKAAEEHNPFNQLQPYAEGAHELKLTKQPTSHKDTFENAIKTAIRGLASFINVYPTNGLITASQAISNALGVANEDPQYKKYKNKLVALLKDIQYLQRNIIVSSKQYEHFLKFAKYLYKMPHKPLQ